MIQYQLILNQISRGGLSCKNTYHIVPKPTEDYTPLCGRELVGIHGFNGDVKAWEFDLYRHRFDLCKACVKKYAAELPEQLEKLTTVYSSSHERRMAKESKKDR